MPPRAELTSGQASGSRWATAGGGLRNPEDDDSLALALNRVKLGASRKRSGFTIKFTRICAWHVPNTDENGLPDPYVRFTLEGGKDSRPPVGMTPDQRNQVNPKWEKPVRLRVPPTHQAAEQLCPVVLVALVDRDPEGEDDSMSSPCGATERKGPDLHDHVPHSRHQPAPQTAQKRGRRCGHSLHYEIEPAALQRTRQQLSELEYSGGKWSKVSPPRPMAAPLASEIEKLGTVKANVIRMQDRWAYERMNDLCSVGVGDCRPLRMSVTVDRHGLGQKTNVTLVKCALDRTAGNPAYLHIHMSLRRTAQEHQRRSPRAHAHTARSNVCNTALNSSVR